jgi:hypothetical protein
VQRFLHGIPLRIGRALTPRSPFVSSIKSLLKVALLPKHLATPPILVVVEFKRRWFTDKISLLESVVAWLYGSDDRDEWWNLKAQLVQLCLVEMNTVVEANDPESEAVIRALPDVRELVVAMNCRDRAKAVECGCAVLGTLSGRDLGSPAAVA